MSAYLIAWQLENSHAENDLYLINNQQIEKSCAGLIKLLRITINVCIKNDNPILQYRLNECAKQNFNERIKFKIFNKSINRAKNFKVLQYTISILGPGPSKLFSFKPIDFF